MSNHQSENLTYFRVFSQTEVKSEYNCNEQAFIGSAVFTAYSHQKILDFFQKRL